MPMPRAFASAGDPKRTGAPRDRQLPFVGGVDAAEDFHQCRLAGAVFPQQPVDFACPEVKIDAVKRHRAAEALGNAAQREQFLWLKVGGAGDNG